MSRSAASKRYKVFIFDSISLFFIVPAIFYPRPVTFKLLVAALIVLYIVQRWFGGPSHAWRMIKQFFVGSKKKVRPIYYDIDNK